LLIDEEGTWGTLGDEFFSFCKKKYMDGEGSQMKHYGPCIIDSSVVQASQGAA
jgi:hypothetical protein